ncbi:MAG: uncharacterized protein A8A55_3053, partial [Amphiamblys sp. WSBS2006]
STATKAELEIIEQEEAACKQLEEMIEASVAEIARLTKMAKEAQALLAEKRQALKPKTTPPAKEAQNQKEWGAQRSLKKALKEEQARKRTRAVEPPAASSEPTSRERLRTLLKKYHQIAIPLHRASTFGLATVTNDKTTMSLDSELLLH